MNLIYGSKDASFSMVKLYSELESEKVDFVASMVLIIIFLAVWICLLNYLVFYYDEVLFADPVEVKRGLPSGDCIAGLSDHADFWDSLKLQVN
ncbi:MAG: hypothetical protein K6G80_04360 [Treponema sp.]|nr:hypothetical protein [Treponema sp.]